MIEKSILVVDDEAKILEIVSSYFEKEGFKIYQAVNGTLAMDIVKTRPIHCVVLDLMLPDIPGEKVCRQIRGFSRIPIIMLTAKVEEKDLLRGFCEGADDYLTKPFSPRELVTRVKALIRRSQGQAMREIFMLNQGKVTINTKTMEVRRDNAVLKLTPNESRILETLTANPGRIFSREDLIHFALGESYSGADRTMDTYIKNLRKKMEINYHEPRYLLTVHGLGYKFQWDE
ncbi:MAG: response regulator transcription factor [Spirochaetales bacterium]|nr:response regulator transcription factor [Spirochaetales bacterium]